MSQEPQHRADVVEQAYAPQPAPTGAAPAPYVPPTAPGFVTGSMGRRLGARLLDGLVLGVPLGLVIGVLAGVAGATAQDTGEPAAAPLILLGVVAYVVAPVASALYEILLTARGGTLGKRWLGLRVVRRETGALPGGLSGFLRWLVFVAANVVPVIGPVLMAVSPFFDSSGLRRGWHDHAAGTRVVDVRPESGGRTPPDSSPGTSRAV